MSVYGQVIEFAKQIQKDKLDKIIYVKDSNVYLIDKNELPNQYYQKTSILIVDDPVKYLKELNKREPTEQELKQFELISNKQLESKSGVYITLRDIKDVSEKYATDELIQHLRGKNLDIVQYIINTIEDMNFVRKGDAWYYDGSDTADIFSRIATVMSDNDDSKNIYDERYYAMIGRILINPDKYLPIILDIIDHIIPPKALRLNYNRLEISFKDFKDLYQSKYSKDKFDHNLQHTAQFLINEYGYELGEIRDAKKIVKIFNKKFK